MLEVKDNTQPIRCHECDSTKLINNVKQGTIVCEQCGLVQHSSCIDESAEWRNFGGDGDNTGKADMNRVGGTINPFLSNGGLETNVKGSGAEQYARWLVKGNIGATSSKKQPGASAPNKDRQIQVGMSFLQELSTRLNIMGPTLSKAYEILKKVHDSDISRGLKINVKAATIMFIACKLTNSNKELT